MTASAFEPGINIFGYARAESGVGEITRLVAASAREAGLPYTVTPYTRTVSRQQDPFEEENGGEPAFGVNLIAVNADELPGFVETFGPELFADRYTIGIWAWEVEEFPGWMARSEELVDEIWGISDFTAEAIRKQVDRPVKSFPLPVRTPHPPPLTRDDLGLPDGFLFLFCFDFDSVFERKNPIGLVEAFCQAFRDGEGPQLVIKSVNGDRFPKQLAALRASTGGRSDIRIVDGYWSSDRKQALMNLSDAYVSLHRSEGFGLTLAESMALGKPVIATAYSGNLDFMDEDDALLVPFRWTTVPEGCGPYAPGARWADPDLASAAEKMRYVVEHPKVARQQAELARVRLEELHGPGSRGALLARRLEEISGRNGGAQTHEAGTPVESADKSVAAGSSDGHVARLESLLDSGPDLEGGSRFGRFGLLLRRAMFRVLRGYDLHQRDIGDATLRALTDLEGRLAASQKRTRELEQRVLELEQRAKAADSDG